MTDDEKSQDLRLADQTTGGGRLAATLLELWQRTRMDWGFVTDRLSQTFRRERWIGARERRFISETLYGLVRHLRRIDAGLARGSQRRGPPRDLDRLIAYLTLSQLLPIERARAAAPEVDWAKVVGIDDVIAAERDSVARIALAASLPDWLARRLVDDWGQSAEPLAAALNQRAPMTVRANLLRGDRKTLIEALAGENILAEPGRYADTAVHVTTRTNLFGLEAFRAGLMEAQDEGSQLLADLAVPPPRGIVVDLCAGAGGKTLALAARMGNRGRVLACDVDARKLEELRRRARRAQVSCIQPIDLDDAGWPPPLLKLLGKADRVLVDAPCSGIGALRRNPEARWRLTDPDIAEFAARQQRITARAADLVAPGGLLIYATCTVLNAENQAVVEAVCAGNPALRVVPLVEVWPGREELASGDGRFLALRPDRHGTDGFFAAVMRKAG